MSLSTAAGAATGANATAKPGASAAGKAAGAKAAGTRNAAAKKTGTRTPRLPASEIVSRHVTARGGLGAWKAVKTLSMTGKLEAGSADSVAKSMRIGRANPKNRKELTAPPPPEAEKQVQLPFRLSTQRPNKSRLEVEFAGKTAVQVYDGKNGWKVRPFLNRREVEPFTAQEAHSAAANPDAEDPLIDYKAKGVRVAFDGIEQVDGRDAYKLKLTRKSGVVQRMWIDAQTFLDVKVEGAPRRMDGKLHTVWVYQRDFRTVQGLRIPFQVETVVEGYPQGHKLLVEQVALNPRLDAATFAKPKA